MVIFLLSWMMLNEPDLIPIPQIVETIKAEKKPLSYSMFRRITPPQPTPGTQVLAPMRRHGAKMIPALKELLTDKSPIVRMNAIFALSNLNDVAAEREIIPMLADEELSVRLHAAQHLTMLQNDEVRAALLKALADPEPRMRKQVVNRFYSPGSEGPLAKEISNYDRLVMVKALGRLAGDLDADVRLALCYTLKSFQDSNTTQALLQLIQDEKPEVRAAAAHALSRSGRALVVSPALLKAVSDEREIALAAIFSLGELRDPLATKRLIQALEEPELRRQSIVALGMIGDRRATEPLIPYLTDQDDRTRHQTAWALGEIRDERAVEPLIQALNAETERSDSIVHALGEFNDPRAIKPMVDKMYSEPNSMYLANAAVEAMKRIRHPDAIRIPVEAAMAQPTPFASFAIRRMTGHNQSMESFVKWWKQNQSFYENAQ